MARDRWEWRNVLLAANAHSSALKEEENISTIINPGFATHYKKLFKDLSLFSHSK